MKLNDSLTGAGLIVLASAMFWTALRFPSMPGDPVGPALFPQMIATGFATCGLVMLFQSLRRGEIVPAIALPDWIRTPRLVTGFALVASGLLAYCLFVERLGFFICAPILLGALLVVLRVRAWAVPLIALGVSLLIHSIFYRGLGVPLPWGLLQDWAW